MSEKQQKKLYTVREFAAIVGRSEASVYRWIRDGLIDCWEVEKGRSTREAIYSFSPADIRQGKKLAKSLIHQRGRKKMTDGQVARHLAAAINRFADGRFHISADDVRSIFGEWEKREKYRGS